MIGGKVVDPSALAAYVRGSVAMDAWTATAAQMGMVLYLPTLAAVELRAVHPELEHELARFLAYPSVFQAGLSQQDAPKVAQLLAESRAWDATAGHVVLVARERGWPVLSADPDRLRRIAPDLDIDLL